MKMTMKALSAAALMAGTLATAPSDAATYTFVGTTSNPLKTFVGSFDLAGSAADYSLTSFSGTFDGFSYTLANTGLSNLGDGRINIGGIQGGTIGVSGISNDFFTNYFVPSAGTVIAPFGFITSTNNFNSNISFAITQATGAVPEPATWAMMILGMGAVGFAMRRKSKVTTRVSFAV
jgi:hypothetical protein